MWEKHNKNIVHEWNPEVEIKSDGFEWYFKSILLYFKQTTIFQVYVLKRPHVDEFLQKMGELFECVLFTASLAKVSPARPVLTR